jgi:hypothetical protein
MVQRLFSLAQYKQDYINAISDTDHRTLAVWAIDCNERVMHYFEKSYPNDTRPRNAISTLKKWIDTGDFSMNIIRRASLDSHAAAKEYGNDTPACSVAHSAGQAVATAHVATHSIGSALYALQAIYRNSKDDKATRNINTEKDWQLKHLNELKAKDKLT